MAGLFLELRHKKGFGFEEQGKTVRQLSFMKGVQAAPLIFQMKSFKDLSANPVLREAIDFVFAAGGTLTSAQVNSMIGMARTHGMYASIDALSHHVPWSVVILSLSQIADVASKVINSFATGIVLQKMWSGQTSGTVRVVSTAALLVLSLQITKISKLKKMLKDFG